MAVAFTVAARLLPRPGPVWGDYPQRMPHDNAPPWRLPRLSMAWRSAKAQAAHTARAAVRRSAAWAAMNGAEHETALGQLQARLRREGLQPERVAEALAAAAAAAQRTLGLAPRPSQFLAAAVLVDQRFAEMATGEGKTLAVGLAASALGLAGVPVHAVTANDYLAARDAQTLEPMYRALGLRVTALAPGEPHSARRSAYRNDIVYTTARELAFDHLRDRLGAEPMMRGLCCALLDEADSILLDEADVPLVLSHAAPQAARRAFLWQALALARELQPASDYVLDLAHRSARLTEAGEARTAQLAADLGGPWQRPRYRREALQLALVALHACRRDTHYLVRDGQVALIDEVTGRLAEGRVWSRGLHTLVALKEGLSPPDETDALAQTTFQHFFGRYWRLSGLSGTLREARGELRRVFGASVVRIPLHEPCRRKTLPPRLFADAQARWAAVVERVASLRSVGRPVLVGTNSVADSEAISTHLAAAGIPHRVLNALRHAEEASIVAEAGRAGHVTVATRMAGRGTDIALDDAARVAGGLHVLSCQDNPSRRLDRQLAGRAGRHGDPGSEEAWLLSGFSGPVGAPSADTLLRWTPTAFQAAPRLHAVAHLFNQSLQERRRSALRQELLRQDRLWARRLAFAGFTSD